MEGPGAITREEYERERKSPQAVGAQAMSEIRLIRVGGRVVWDRASGTPMPKTLDIELVKVLEEDEPSLHVRGPSLTDWEKQAEAAAIAHTRIFEGTNWLPWSEQSTSCQAQWLHFRAQFLEILGVEKLQRELRTERAMKEGCQAHLLDIADCLNEVGIDVQEDEPTSARAIRALREMQAALEVAQLLVGQTPTKE